MALTRITKGVIKPNENYDTHNINSTGIVTAIGLDINGNGDVSGNLSVGGVLTYEDVTSIDSVGIITAQKGIHVGAGVSAVGVGTFGSLDISGDIDVDGHTNLDNVSIAGVTTITGNIHAEAKIGIGKASPAYKLDILETTNTRALVIKYGNSTNSTSGVEIQNGNGPGRLYLGVMGSSAGYGQINANDAYLSTGEDLSIHSISNTGVIKFGIGASGPVEKMRITSTGVDINRDLDVDGHTNLDNVSISGIATALRLDVKNGSQEALFAANQLQFNPTGAAYIDHKTTSQDIIFRVSNSSATDTTSLVLKSNGNIGIASNSPAERLVVQGDVNSFLAFDKDGGGFDGTSGGALVLGSVFDYSGARLGLYADNSGGGRLMTKTGQSLYLGTNNTRRVSINNIGYVGINTTNAAKLFTIRHVHGRNQQFSYDDNVITIKGANDNNNPESMRFIADTLRLNTGTTGSGTEALRIDNGGRILTNGETATEVSPGGIHIKTSNGAATTQALILENHASNANTEVQIKMVPSTSTPNDRFNAITCVNVDGQNKFDTVFATCPGGVPQERLRIGNDGLTTLKGNMLINNPSGVSLLQLNDANNNALHEFGTPGNGDLKITVDKNNIATGPEFQLYMRGDDATDLAFHIDHDRNVTIPNGNLKLGNNSSTAVNSSNLVNIDLGGTHHDTAGSTGKLKLWKGSQDEISLGVSNNQMDFILTSTSYSYNFYGGASGTTRLMQLNQTGNNQFLLGNHTSTSTTAPLTVDLGGTHSSAAGNGNNLSAKLKLWNNNSDLMGFSVSSNQLDYIVTSTSFAHVFYGGDAGTTELVRINGDGKLYQTSSGVETVDFGTTSTNGAYHKYDLSANGATTGYIGAGNQLVQGAVSTDFAFRGQSNMVFSTGGDTERLRIASGGKVHINYNAGSNAGNDKLNIMGGGDGITIARSTSNANDGNILGNLSFHSYMNGSYHANAEAKIEALADTGQSGSSAPTHLDFYTKSSNVGPGASPTRRLRITSDGKVVAGSDGSGYPERLQSHAAGSCLGLNSTSGAAELRFYENGTGRFRMKTLGGNPGILFEDWTNGATRAEIAGDGDFKIYTGTRSWATVQYRSNNRGVRRHYREFGTGSSGSTFNLIRVRRHYWGWGHYRFRIMRGYYSGIVDSIYYLNGHGRNDGSYNPSYVINELQFGGDTSNFSYSGRITITTPSNSSPGNDYATYVDVQVHVPAYQYFTIEVEAFSAGYSLDTSNIGNDAYALHN